MRRQLNKGEAVNVRDRATSIARLRTDVAILASDCLAASAIWGDGHPVLGFDTSVRRARIFSLTAYGGQAMGFSSATPPTA
jgi:hypothetical protein